MGYSKRDYDALALVFKNMRGYATTEGELILLDRTIQEVAATLGSLNPNFRNQLFREASNHAGYTECPNGCQEGAIRVVVGDEPGDGTADYWTECPVCYGRGIVSLDEAVAVTEGRVRQ